MQNGEAEVPLGGLADPERETEELPTETGSHRSRLGPPLGLSTLHQQETRLK